MILDATAGNRTMWLKKNSDNIIYIDKERRLNVKPTIFCDNTQTPFPDKTFDTIFYDPPHDYGWDDSDVLTMTKAQIETDKKFKKRLHSYYGAATMKDKQALIRHIYYAQKEFHRILKDDGLLWLKWCEVTIKLKRVLSLFNEWAVLLEMPVKAAQHSLGKQQTYWDCLCKKGMELKQQPLSDFIG